MKLLFLTNFYPPLDRGGWEQWCQEVAVALRGRGHDVHILTSRYRREAAPAGERHVDRLLHLESDVDHYRPFDNALNLRRRDRYNRHCVTAAIRDGQPDLVVIWGMWQLDAGLAALAERLMNGRVAYYFCGYWPIEEDVHHPYWFNRSGGRWPGRLLKRLLGPLLRPYIAARAAERPAFPHVACVSHAVLARLRAGGQPLPAAEIIYGGIDLGRYERPIRPQPQQPLQLLFAGSMTPEKGVDTAVEALATLAAVHSPDAFHLTIIGHGPAAFERQLRETVQSEGLGETITFKGWIDKEEMPDFMGGFDVLLFPSRWAEPLARMTMQGMAAGLALVSTTTGGSQEVLVDGENSLTFPAGDVTALAHSIGRLLDEPALVTRLAHAGRQFAQANFDFERMVDEMERLFARSAHDEGEVAVAAQ